VTLVACRQLPRNRFVPLLGPLEGWNSSLELWAESADSYWLYYVADKRADLGPDNCRRLRGTFHIFRNFFAAVLRYTIHRVPGLAYKYGGARRSSPTRMPFSAPLVVVAYLTGCICTMSPIAVDSLSMLRIGERGTERCQFVLIPVSTRDAGRPNLIVSAFHFIQWAAPR
jgi:hypothetical protein